MAKDSSGNTQYGSPLPKKASSSKGTPKAKPGEGKKPKCQNY